MLLIAVIVFFTESAYSLLHAYTLIPKLSKGIEPLLRFFGLPASTGFLWLIGLYCGLAYGGALMMDQMKEGKVNRTDAKFVELSSCHVSFRTGR
jgi:hypothetical protein